MKNLFILIFAMISGIIYCQTKYIVQKDFIPNGQNSGKDLVKADKMITTFDGENKNVNTKLFIGKNKVDKHDYVFSNKMIDILLFEAKYTLKNKSSFSAQNIRIYQVNENKWSASTSYSGANSFGGKKDSEISIDFDNELKYKITYRSPEF